MAKIADLPTPPWAKPHEIKGKLGLILLLHVQPGASKSEIKGQHGDRLKISIQSPPVDGAANDAIIEFFKDLLAIPRSQFHFLSGLTSRQKNLFVETAQIAKIISLLVR